MLCRKNTFINLNGSGAVLEYTTEIYSTGAVFVARPVTDDDDDGGEAPGF